MRGSRAAAVTVTAALGPIPAGALRVIEQNRSFPATPATLPASRLAGVASVAGARPAEQRNTLGTWADGLYPDAAALAEALRLRGPMTYGTAASVLGWTATRAWQAEARLRAAGLVQFDDLGRATLDQDDRR